jgi:hypothetical protein
MTDYWVSFRIAESSSGSHLGFGSCRTPMTRPPATALEVDQLSDSITNQSLPSGQHAVVMSWSEMGR